MGSGQFIQNYNNGLFTILAHGTYRDLRNPLPGPYILVDRWAGGTRATYDFNNLPFDFQIGGEMNWQRDDRQQRNNDGGNPGENLMINQIDHVRSQGIFAKSVFDLDRLTLSLGLRGDRMVFTVDDFIDNAESDRTFTTLNPSVGLHYYFGSVRWFSNFSTSFESPTTTEFKNRLDPSGTILPGFNPDLNPERTIGIESGVRGNWQSVNMDYEITGFYQYVTDQIIQETEIDGEAIFSNGGKADHYGIETHVRLRPADYYSLELMYTWTDASFAGGQQDGGVNFEGNKLPGVSPHRFGSIISLMLGNHTISTDVEWIGEYFGDSENSAVNDSYMLVNGRWTFGGFDFNNWKIQPFFSVYNIFNVRYNTSVAINNAFGRFYEPGSSRSLYGGLSVQF